MAEARSRRLQHFSSDIFNTITRSQSSQQFSRPATSNPKKIGRNISKLDQGKAAGYTPKKYGDWDYKSRNTFMPHVTFSQVFTQPNQGYRCESPYKPWDHEIINQSSESNFYRKSVSPLIDNPKQFEPKYDEKSAFNRRQMEFYGKGNNRKGQKAKLEDVCIRDNFQSYEPIDRNRENLNAYQRRHYHMSSSIFNLDEKYQAKDTRPQTAKVKKQEEYDPEYQQGNLVYNSSIFKDSKQNAWPKLRKEREIIDDKRAKNHLYSDLFDTQYRDGTKPQDKLIATTSDFLDYEYSNRKHLITDYSPKVQKLKNMRSEFDPQRSQTPNPNSVQILNKPDLNCKQRKQLEQCSDLAQEIQLPNRLKPEVMTIRLENLKPQMNEREIKKLCQNLHVISAKADIDNITGRCQGTGEIQIRTNKRQANQLNNIQRKFQEFGVNASLKENTKDSKSAYADLTTCRWDDVNVQIGQKGYMGQNSKQTKQNELKSQIPFAQNRRSQKPTGKVFKPVLASKYENILNQQKIRFINGA